MVLLCTAAIPALADSKPVCHGLTLPAGSKRISQDAKDCRFVSSLNWDETMKFFDRQLPSSQTRWHREVNIPAAKFRHVENTAAKSTWDGLNIYVKGGDDSGDVRLFVIPRPQEPKKTPDKAAGKGGGKAGKK